MNLCYCSCPENLEIFPNTAKALKLLSEHGFEIIVITNQSSIAIGYFTEETLAEIHDKMKKELAKDSAHVDDIYYCPHNPGDNCDCRKPKPKLVFQAANNHHIDLKQSFVIGDLPMDIQLGNAVGCRAILVSSLPSGTEGERANADAIVSDLLEAAQTILKW